MKRTGHLAHVGSGRYFDVPPVLIFFTCMQLLIVSGMYRRCGEILCSFSEEEKLPKLSEEKPSPVVQLSKIKELTMVRGDVMKNIEYNFC